MVKVKSFPVICYSFDLSVAVTFPSRSFSVSSKTDKDRERDKNFKHNSNTTIRLINVLTFRFLHSVKFSPEDKENISIMVL